MNDMNICNENISPFNEEEFSSLKTINSFVSLLHLDSRSENSIYLILPTIRKTQPNSEMELKSRTWRGFELTVNKGREEHSEAAQSALFISPHPDDSHAVIEHHVVGHSAAELGFEVFDGAAAIVHSNKVLLALIRMLHLVLHEAQVDLHTHSTLGPESNYIDSNFSLNK